MTDIFYGQGFVDREDEAEEGYSSIPTITNFKRVDEFMKVFGQEVKTFPEFPSETIQQLRIDLIEEELGELKEAIEQKDIVAVADALTDILYVVYGAGSAFGIDLDACFEEVHESNMSKLDVDGKPIFREDGKVLKGPNYFKPDLFRVLFQTDADTALDPETMEVVSLNPDDEGGYDVELRDASGVHHTFKAQYDEASGCLMLH